MKNIRNFTAALVLTTILSSAAFAGQIQTGYTCPPPTEGAPAVQCTQTDQNATTNGQIQTGLTGTNDSTSEGSTVDPLLQLLLSILTGLGTIG